MSTNAGMTLPASTKPESSASPWPTLLPHSITFDGAIKGFKKQVTAELILQFRQFGSKNTIFPLIKLRSPDEQDRVPLKSLNFGEPMHAEMFATLPSLQADYLLRGPESPVFRLLNKLASDILYKMRLEIKTEGNKVFFTLRCCGIPWRATLVAEHEAWKKLTEDFFEFTT